MVAPAKTLARILSDPGEFVHFYWPDIRLYDKQLEALWSLKENRDTLIHAGTALGKDFIASLGVHWFFASRSPCKIIVSSTSEDHLRTVLWAEISERTRTARFPLPYKSDYLRIRRYTRDGYGKEFENESYVEGRVVSTVERFQGVHLDNDIPRVMVLFDEASGFLNGFYEASASWAHRRFMIGNPLNTINFFFTQKKKGEIPDPSGLNKLNQHVIKIGAEDSPNVKWGRECEKLGLDPLTPPPPEVRIPGVVSYAERLAQLAEWDEYNLTTRGDGEFFEGEESLLYPPDWLNHAELLAHELEVQKIARRGKAMGLDGGEGKSLTAWTVVDELGVVYHEAFKTPDTKKIVDRTVSLMREWGVPGERIFVDRGGGGRQIAQLGLRPKGIDVQTVSFGEAASPLVGERVKRLEDKKEREDERKAFKNRRAEMYWLLRQQLNVIMNPKGFAIPARYAELRAELAPLPFLHDEDGVMYMLPKDRKPGQENSKLVTIKDLLGHSPDRADSLVLAVYGLKSKALRRKLRAFA